MSALSHKEETANLLIDRNMSDKSDEELFANLHDGGMCLVRFHSGWKGELDLAAALQRADQLTRNQKSVTSISVLGKAIIYPDQIQRLLDRQSRNSNQFGFAVGIVD